MVQHVGRHYVRYVNRKHGRGGTLWEGRYKGSLVQEETYLLRCYRYIELKPVRAGMAAADRYRWPSHPCNADGAADRLIEPHALYTQLGAGPSQRRAAYRDLFEDALDDARLDAIRCAWRTGTPLGDDRLRDRIANAAGRGVGYAQRGRPGNRTDRADKGL